MKTNKHTAQELKELEADGWIKTNHGGKRKNAGRKPTGEHRKVRLAVFVHPETAKYLKSQDLSIGTVVDNLVKLTLERGEK